MRASRSLILKRFVVILSCLLAVLLVNGCGNNVQEDITFQTDDPISISNSSYDKASEEFGNFISQQELSGIFELRQTDNGSWGLYWVEQHQAEVDTDDPAIMDDLSSKQIQDDSSDSHDYASVSTSSGTCTSKLAGSDDGWWDWYIYPWFEDGDHYGSANGSWSGCGSSGGYLKITMTWNGSSLNWAAGIPAGVSVSSDSSTKKTVEMTSPRTSGRYASVGYCISGVEGYLTSRVYTVLLYVPNGNSAFYLSKSYTSYMNMDATRGPSCG